VVEEQVPAVETVPHVEQSTALPTAEETPGVESQQEEQKVEDATATAPAVEPEKPAVAKGPKRRG
jgi:hypothetical protein